MEQEKTCRNCKHYKAHYVRYDNGKYMKIECGHCACVYLNMHAGQCHIDKNVPCKYWEPTPSEKEPDAKALLAELIVLLKRFTEIVVRFDKTLE